MGERRFDDDLPRPGGQPTPVMTLARGDGIGA